MMLRHRRFDVRVQRMSGARIEVYWRADESGCGPCMSAYAGKRERLRFDLFTPAHMHDGAFAKSPRVYYPEGLPLASYIELAIADLMRKFPSGRRAAGWAAEQLTKVSGPTTPVPPEVRRPVKLPHGLRAR